MEPIRTFYKYCREKLNHVHGTARYKTNIVADLQKHIKKVSFIAVKDYYLSTFLIT
jgi:hypothetical protein